MQNIWFTSDTHFGHKGILSFHPSRGDDLEAMDNMLIDGINEHVKPNDILWHLGDFCWKNSKSGHYRQRLNVKQIHVCQGNHDPNSLERQVSTMQLMAFKKFGDTHFHMAHYPVIAWDRRFHGGCCLYGHSHGLFEPMLNQIWPYRRSMDAGVDNAYRLLGEFRPFELSEVLEHIANRPLPRDITIEPWKILTCDLLDLSDEEASESERDGGAKEMPSWPLYSGGRGVIGPIAEELCKRLLGDTMAGWTIIHEENVTKVILDYATADFLDEGSLALYVFVDRAMVYRPGQGQGQHISPPGSVCFFYRDPDFYESLAEYFELLRSQI